MRTAISYGALFTIVLLSGCGPKLDKDYSFQLGTADEYKLIEPIKSEQKIKITGAATEAPVNVYVYLKKNEVAAAKEILALKLTANILNSQLKTQTINLEATIPANEEAVVQVSRAGKATPVQLKISNQ